MAAAAFADLFRGFYGALETLHAEYFAYGGVVVAVWGAPRETVEKYLILYMLVAHRYKDLGDAETVLVRQRGQLDLAYLRRWADEIARGTGRFEVPGKLEDLIEKVRP